MPESALTIESPTMSNAIPTDLISTTAAARRLDLRSPRTVRNWIECGRLTGYRVGNRWKVSASELLALVEATATDAPTARDLQAATNSHQNAVAKLRERGIF
jgi:excisionase family DNA binding protein